MVLDYKNRFHECDNIASNLIIGDTTLSDPLVSVIMPIYNHPDFFEKSLMSVINQKCDFYYEIVIIDNNHPILSKRNREIVERCKSDNLRYYLNEENIGSANNVNRGIQLARGKFISFCHDDDMLFEDSLQVLVNYSKLAEDERMAILGRIESIDKDDKIITKFTEWDSIFLKRKNKYKIQLYDFLFRNYTNGGGALYYRESLIELGGYCKDYLPVTDYALNVNYVSTIGAYAISDKTLKYRVSSQSDTGKVYGQMADIIIGIRKNVSEQCKFPWYLPKSYLNINLKMFKLNLYSRWDKNKPSLVISYFYKLINRLFINFIFIDRSLR